tara:strand:+ start:176 stop:1417 length:1242 start_codon:yes stop_codon:yes gene_type:complete
MADQVKEIFAGTISASDVATGSTTLFTTDASTQYVIKDVQVSSSFLGVPELAINNFDVSSLATSATGSEIVDVSSTVKYKVSATAPVFANSEQAGLATGASLVKHKTTQLAVNGVLSGSPVTTEVSTSFASLSNQSQGVMYAVASNGDIYYGKTDGNSVQTIRKKTVAGTETAVISNLGYGWSVFDGNETIYYCGANVYGSTILRKLNINTGVDTFANLGLTFCGSSYPFGVMTNNGKIACIYSGYTTSVFLIDPVADTITRVDGMASWNYSGTNYNLAAYYDETTNRYTFWRRTNNTIYRSTANNEIVIGSPNTYTGGHSSNGSALSAYSITSSNILFSYARCDAVSFTQFKDNFKESYTPDSNNNVVTLKIDNYLPYNILYGLYYDLQATTTASNVTETVNVRVTGVKTTL